MNKNISGLLPDEKGRLKKIELINGQVIELFYDDQGTVKGLFIGAKTDDCNKAEQEAEPNLTVDLIEKGEPVANEAVPNPPPLVKDEDQTKDLEKETVVEKKGPPPPPSVKMSSPQIAPPGLASEPHNNDKAIATEPEERCCGNCDEKISKTALFCGHCGTRQ